MPGNAVYRKQNDDTVRITG